MDGGSVRVCRPCGPHEAVGPREGHAEPVGCVFQRETLLMEGDFSRLRFMERVASRRTRLWTPFEGCPPFQAAPGMRANRQKKKLKMGPGMTLTSHPHWLEIQQLCSSYETESDTRGVPTEGRDEGDVCHTICNLASFAPPS